MDILAPFFAHFALSARVFYAGQLCGISGDHASKTAGHLHVLRGGVLHVTQPNGKKWKVEEPSVLFYPRPHRHRFRTDAKQGADLVCATIEFGAAMLNTLMIALPPVLVVPIKSITALGPAVDLLFAEAFAQLPARQLAVDRLTEYFLVLLLRSAIAEQLVTGGVLAGLADGRLGHAIAAMHARPEHVWTLSALAGIAGMSRARFAVHFRETVGQTPFDYLTNWRIGVAQSKLGRGEPLKIVAPLVGYATSAALTRAFVQRLGITPTGWLGERTAKKKR